MATRGRPRKQGIMNKRTQLMHTLAANPTVQAQQSTFHQESKTAFKAAQRKNASSQGKRKSSASGQLPVQDRILPETEIPYLEPLKLPVTIFDPHTPRCAATLLGMDNEDGRLRCQIPGMSFGSATDAGAGTGGMVPTIASCSFVKFQTAPKHLQPYLMGPFVEPDMWRVFPTLQHAYDQMQPTASGKKAKYVMDCFHVLVSHVMGGKPDGMCQYFCVPLSYYCKIRPAQHKLNSVGVGPGFKNSHAFTLQMRNLLARMSIASLPSEERCTIFVFPEFGTTAPEPPKSRIFQEKEKPDKEEEDALMDLEHDVNLSERGGAQPEEKKYIIPEAIKRGDSRAALKHAVDTHKGLRPVKFPVYPMSPHVSVPHFIDPVQLVQSCPNPSFRQQQVMNYVLQQQSSDEKKR